MRTLCLVLCLAAGAAQAYDASCDPNRTVLDQARDLRTAHHPDKALAIVKPLADGNPKDFRASYTLGLSLIDLGREAEGMKALEHAADLLDREYKACGTTNGWYAIYNTLGAEYYNQGRYGPAESALNAAYAKFDSLGQDTQAKLLKNLGLLYLHAGNLQKSNTYYQRAAKMHAAGAIDKARLVQGLIVQSGKSPVK